MVATPPLLSDCRAGMVFGFRTTPVYEDSPSPTGRFGAFKVLARTDTIVVLAALDGVWAQPPTLADTEGLGVLHQHRWAFRGRPAALGCDPTWTLGLEDLTFLGEAPLTDEERRIAGPYESGDYAGTSFGSPSNVDSNVEGEWRRKHDREALALERAAEDERRHAALHAAQERYRTRLKGLTFETLLSETPFARWTPSPPFPSAEFRDAAAARVHETCRELQALGDKPRKPAAREAIKALVLWFNAADEAAGGVIETEEREDIVGVIEEIAHAAKHRSLATEANSWREW